MSEVSAADGMNFEKSVMERIRDIKLIVLDVDGVLTDGGIYITETGEMRRFDVQDGMGISLAREAGLEVALMTGRDSAVVRKRAAELRIDKLYQGVRNKSEKLQELARESGLFLNELCFMGDDLIDLPAMRLVGLAAAPSNAVSDVKTGAHHVTLAAGGHGAVRELIEIILRNQGKWDALLSRYLIDVMPLSQ